jgi:hypothetical protein
MVSSTIPSAFSRHTKTTKAKVSKIPGLSLHLHRPQSEQVLTPIVLLSDQQLIRNLQSGVVYSSANSSEDNDEAQYVLISPDSPFYKSILAPRTSAFPSFTGFAFACDALAEENALIVKMPHELFDEELQHIVPPISRHARRAKGPKSPGLLLNLTREVSQSNQVRVLDFCHLVHRLNINIFSVLSCVNGQPRPTL